MPSIAAASCPSSRTGSKHFLVTPCTVDGKRVAGTRQSLSWQATGVILRGPHAEAEQQSSIVAAVARTRPFLEHRALVTTSQRRVTNNFRNAGTALRMCQL